MDYRPVKQTTACSGSRESCQLGWSVCGCSQLYVEVIMQVCLWVFLAVPWHRINGSCCRHWLLLVLPGGEEFTHYGVLQEPRTSGMKTPLHSCTHSGDYRQQAVLDEWLYLEVFLLIDRRSDLISCQVLCVTINRVCQVLLYEFYCCVFCC